jgi:hypothetical protein
LLLPPVSAGSGVILMSRWWNISGAIRHAWVSLQWQIILMIINSKKQMKNLVLVISILFGQVHLVKADTISYCHVYYNNTRVGDYTEYATNRTIAIKAADIKRADRIVVRYFRDTPCYDCWSFLAIEDKKRRRIVLAKAKGTSNPISFYVKDLLEQRKQSHKSSFEIFYSENDLTNSGASLFIIKFE